MNRIEFIDELHKYSVGLSKEEQDAIMKNSLATDGNLLTSIVAIEELAELQKEISKHLRGQGDEFALLEEIADVLISVEHLTQIYHFSASLVNRAVSVKLARQKRRLSGGE